MVSNGLEVIEALQRQEYDVILMDVLMPEMDGLQAARAVRDGEWKNSRENKDRAAQPYIIAMTANAMQGDREACIAAGMDDYISKPIQIEELALALSRAANIHKAEMAKSQALSEKNPAAVIDDEIFRKFQASLGDEDGSVIASLVQDFLTEGAQLVQDIHTGCTQWRSGARLARFSFLKIQQPDVWRAGPGRDLQSDRNKGQKRQPGWGRRIDPKNGSGF